MNEGAWAATEQVLIIAASLGLFDFSVSLAHMIIETFSLTELSVTVVAVVGALAACVHGSKCSRIVTPCATCVRDTRPPEPAAESSEDTTPDTSASAPTATIPRT